MDRSFLFADEVVQASRNFVCVRLSTYEDQNEAKFLKSKYVGRSGELENTTFAILGPGGDEKLARAGRGPFHAYRNSRAMAKGMDAIAKEYPKSEKARYSDPQLPLMKNIELALNVASADGLPLIVTSAIDAKKLETLHQRLLSIAWSKQYAGQFVFATIKNSDELKPITGEQPGKSILVVQPGKFGLTGKVVSQFDSSTNIETLKSELAKVVAKFEPEQKDRNSHVNLGIQLGLEWKTQIPETDPQSLRAKERHRRGSE